MTHFSPQNAESTLAIEHCVTLIPCHTLEDFPAFLEDAAAESLLGSWTAPWHPAIIATTGRLPIWARADSLPEPLNSRAIFLSTASHKKLPSSFEAACAGATNCHVIRGASRADYLEKCSTLWPNLEISLDRELTTDARSVSAHDFFALGYAWLQVQMMTRRLRYTSNLDEIFFASRVIEAAKHWLSGEATACVDALHEAFDALAEERDHYFSNDPHLIDLTLLAASTLGSKLNVSLESTRKPNATPINFLIDCDLAKSIHQSVEPAAKSLLELIDAEVVGVAGGGISKAFPIHHQTASSARHVVSAGKTETDRYLGKRCEVFARVAGPTPGDLATAVATNGYAGAIPIDFAAGEGWSNEAKLCWNSQAGTLDVLVAKPIDGSQSSSFLSLAVRLGQAIDSGEIATALIVHWPGHESDAYLDLRRAASWGLALGRFWKIDDFFRDGQRPYHHYRGHADDGAAQWLTSAVQSEAASHLANAASQYRDLIAAEASQSISTLANLIKPMDQSAVPVNESGDEAAEAFCGRLSASPVKAGLTDSAKLHGCVIINSHSAPTRVAIRMRSAPVSNEFVFGASIGSDGLCDVTVDVPAHGFVSLQPSSTPPRKRWFSGRKKIATNGLLANEFMQVEITPKSGGIMGVYSGSTRGNRYSLRLVHVNDDAPDDDSVTEMVGRAMRVVRSDEAEGVIEAEGVLVNRTAHVIADFTIRYSLSRGSRWLWVESELKPASSVSLGANPWKSYFAFRSAVASEVATYFTPLRDKLHRTDSKRFDSPAGLLIDEMPKQTLLFADGRPSHRRRGDRYIDSLMLVRNEVIKPMRFAIGFDVPSPIDALRALISPPAVVACESTSKVPASGWLVHCSTPDVVISDLKTETVSPLTISFLAIVTRGESRKAKIRFCRDIVHAFRESPSSAQSDVEAASESVDGMGLEPFGFSKLEHSSDAIELSLSAHEVVRLRVQLEVR